MKFHEHISALKIIARFTSIDRIKLFTKDRFTLINKDRFTLITKDRITLIVKYTLIDRFALVNSIFRLLLKTLAPSNAYFFKPISLIFVLHKAFK